MRLTGPGCPLRGQAFAPPVDTGHGRGTGRIERPGRPDPEEARVARVEIKSLDAPDERRPFEKGEADLVTIGGTMVGRAVLEPGWRWSEHLKPVVGTDTCEVAHTGYVVSGRLRVVMADGTEAEVGPGDAFAIPPGHDASVVGDQTFVAVDFSGGMADYAKRA